MMAEITDEEEDIQRDAEGELVRLDYDIDTKSGEKAIKVSHTSVSPPPLISTFIPLPTVNLKSHNAIFHARREVEINIGEGNGKLQYFTKP
jgi:hypothetical protein